MKIYIRYFRNFVFGNYATLAFEVEPDSLVIDLKKLIFSRIRVATKYQELRVKNHGVLEPIHDECALCSCQVKEGAFIFLENLDQSNREDEQVRERLSMMNKQPKYLHKLGIMRDMLKEASSETQVALVVDELCSLVRKGCSLDEFKKAALMNNEAVDNQFYGMLGSQGWAVVHAACSSCNLEVVEHLLLEKRVSPNLQGKDNWTPLEIAIQSGFFQLVNLLLEDKRIQVNVVNSDSRGSALHLAAKSNYLPVC